MAIITFTTRIALRMDVAWDVSGERVMAVVRCLYQPKAHLGLDSIQFSPGGFSVTFLCGEHWGATQPEALGKIDELRSLFPLLGDRYSVVTESLSNRAEVLELIQSRA